MLIQAVRLFSPTSLRRATRHCYEGEEGEDAFDGLRFYPPGEQSNECFDVPIECELMAIVRAQVKALDFNRNY